MLSLLVKQEIITGIHSIDITVYNDWEYHIKLPSSERIQDKVQSLDVPHLDRVTHPTTPK